MRGLPVSQTGFLALRQEGSPPSCTTCFSVIARKPKSPDSCWFIEPELAVDWWTGRVLPWHDAWQSSREEIYRVHWERDDGGDARRHVP